MFGGLRFGWKWPPRLARRGKTTERPVAAALVAACSIRPAAAQPIGGEHAVEGKNRTAASTGTVTIILAGETTCEIVWQTGETTSHGICPRKDNAFAAAYVTEDAIGVVIYRVQDDGTPDGLRTIRGKDGVGTEMEAPK